ncbi:hypothetical protein QLQ15_08185 [Lysobacter sp. LF1]|uniref:Secreted protein n=1 Tax=Lysobacter stagni TaxID=3045172 RepID=A0ABT6XFQ5_9GAMM|nr:hypothetical protein [Lysobacter sp. LF1]MDI9238891.1 hypothetical protein [Lysobacter sp. LF1]
MRSIHLRSLLACTVLVATLAIANASAKPPYVPIEQRLNTEQLHATGLDTLSPEQLRLLNQLLSDDRETVARDAVAEHTASNVGLREKRTPDQAVNATVDGEVRQWTNGSTVVLDNGQRWRVIEGSLYLRRPASHPKVTIAPGFMGVWYLQMEGESKKLKVQRVD